MRTLISARRQPHLFEARTFAGLCAARDWLAAHFDCRASLDEVAAHGGLSPFHFHRRFTQAFGETPHEFLTRLRIDRAKKLLLAGNDTVTGICFDVGYESLGSFSSRFRSLTGLSPTQFRDESRRLFGGFRRDWPLYYIPACYQTIFLG